MAKKKSSRRSKSDLGDSWIDAEHESDEQGETTTPLKSSKASIATGTSSSPKTPTRRISKAAKSPEPQFIMPSLHEDDGYNEVSSPRQSRGGPRTHTIPRNTKARDAGIDISQMATNILSFILDILGRALNLMKTPLALGLAVWLFLGLIMIGKNLIFTSVSHAFQPLCNIPGASLLGLSICNNPNSVSGNSANIHFDEVMSTQGRFEDILDKTADGVGLPADMKHSEASMRDLRTLIKYSHLKSKHELELELTGFIDTARQAAWDLQRYGSRVGRAADTILSTTRWTQRVLEGIESTHSSQRNSIAGFISNTLLLPLRPFQALTSSSSSTPESQLLEQYLSHMTIVQTSIDSLLTEGIAMLGILSNLEDRLEVIHDISVRDRVSTQAARDELLGELWTMLGGNRAKLGNIETQRRILSRVEGYRKSAFAQVSGTIVELKMMDAELLELRERVGATEVVGVEGREAGIPLRVHIESLELGVGRLEERRRYQRGVEVGNQRAILDREKDLGPEVKDKRAEIDGR